ncbi:MAG: DUF3501 family protein [Actinobacteria bacterium]|nr:DUF3501 family protein [Actinomycetota bacterium]
MSNLTLDDIADVRAYERERAEFRRRVIALKKRRRVHVGPFVTLLFENRDTIRFQIQEMARAERILTDQGIQTELDIYNPLIPEPGRLSATMFLELTSEAQLREWLPKLVGIETQVELRVGGSRGPGAAVVHGTVDPSHASQLSREETTASVHYIAFDLTPDQAAALAEGPVVLAVTHPAYSYETELDAETRAELAADSA